MTNQESIRHHQKPHRVLHLVLMAVFKLLLVTFLVLGSILVLTQLGSVIIGAKGTLVTILDALELPVTIGASATGLLAFAMSYIFNWERSE